MDCEVTYRLIVVNMPDVTGRTASSPELAKLAPGDVLSFREHRIGLERTDWGERHGKPHPIRTVLIEVENKPGEWTLG